MSEFAMVVAYRVVTTLVGGWIVFMGYRLFTTGVFERAGDLKAAWGEKHLEIKQAAPGTIFALFGAIVLSFSIYKGISYETSQKVTGGNASPYDLSSLLGQAYPKEVMDHIESLAIGEELNDDEKSEVLNWVVEKRITFNAWIDDPDEFAADDTT